MSLFKLKNGQVEGHILKEKVKLVSLDPHSSCSNRLQATLFNLISYCLRKTLFFPFYFMYLG
jgi:hypothetical protein